MRLFSIARVGGHEPKPAPVFAQPGAPSFAQVGVVEPRLGSHEQTGQDQEPCFTARSVVTSQQPRRTSAHRTQAAPTPEKSVAYDRFADYFLPPAHNHRWSLTTGHPGRRHFCQEGTAIMMKKITVAVHERTYRQARVWAAEHDTSLSAVVAWLLETLPGLPRAPRAFPPARNASAP